jgi:hypothetical protein
MSSVMIILSSAFPLRYFGKLNPWFFFINKLSGMDQRTVVVVL